MTWKPQQPLSEAERHVNPPAPTPEELASRALETTWFQWNQERWRAEECVAKVIREDRARIRAVVDRGRMLIPAVIRDLDHALGGRHSK